MYLLQLLQFSSIDNNASAMYGRLVSINNEFVVSSIKCTVYDRNGSPVSLDHRHIFVVAAKYFKLLILSTTFSISLLYNAGIAVSEKYWRDGSSWRESNFLSMFLNPSFSTVYIGNISLHIQPLLSVSFIRLGLIYNSYYGRLMRSYIGLRRRTTEATRLASSS